MVQNGGRMPIGCELLYMHYSLIPNKDIGVDFLNRD